MLSETKLKIRHEYAQSFMPTPEPGQFSDEMNDVEYLKDKTTDISYAVYRINRDF